jgi:N-methylhydantoinase A
VCAYVGPILESYLRRLEDAVAGMGLPKLYVMGSSGGVFDVAEGLKMPAMAIELGPAAGVIAAALIGRQLSKPNIISFDMGGTTAKASLIKADWSKPPPNTRSAAPAASTAGCTAPATRFACR